MKPVLVQSNADASASARRSAVSAEEYRSRICLACGYSLQGLGEEPRCPECGLLNIPQGYREEVWRLVDGGKWFFSGFLSPLRKRPAGWWWALDRPGDVRRSCWVTVRNFVVAAVILSLACLAINLFKVRNETRFSIYDPDSAERSEVEVEIYEEFISPAGNRVERSQTPSGQSIDWDSLQKYYQAGWQSKSSTSRGIVFQPAADMLIDFTPYMLALIVLLWAYPATVGMFTQLRKTLPRFARPKRTIVAAANLESHQMIYNAALIGLCIVLYGAMRLGGIFDDAGISRQFAALAAMHGLIALFAMLRWVGPVRSDYTRQLVQSRSQAARIVILYVLILPWATLQAVINIWNLLIYGNVVGGKDNWYAYY